MFSEKWNLNIVFDEIAAENSGIFSDSAKEKFKDSSICRHLSKKAIQTFSSQNVLFIFFHLFHQKKIFIFVLLNMTRTKKWIYNRKYYHKEQFERNEESFFGDFFFHFSNIVKTAGEKMRKRQWNRIDDSS